MRYHEYAKKVGLPPSTLYSRLQKATISLQTDWEPAAWVTFLQGLEGTKKSKASAPPDPTKLSEDREAAGVTRRLRKVEADLGDRLRLERAVLTQVQSLPTPQIKYIPRTRSKKPRVTPALMVGDLHAGNACAPLALLERRFVALRQKFGEWIDTQRASYTLDECHIFGMGDYIEGALRASARQTNTEQEPQQALGAGNLLAAFISDLAPQFKKVHVALVMVDNHSRLDEKMNFEQAVSRSWNPIVEAIIRGRLESHPNVTIQAPWDFACHVRVENTRFLLIHGNGIRMVRRTPFYGIEDRIVLEKATRQGTPTEFDVMCLAHFHHVGEGQWWFMNPPMVGTTGYDKASGRETMSAQTAFLISPNHVRPFDKITFDLADITMTPVQSKEYPHV